MRLLISMHCLFLSLLIISVPAGAEPAGPGKPWPRHVIDASSRGADGVRLADINRDGNPDIVTGWEEGGLVRVYIHPGTTDGAVRRPWPAVTVGKVRSPEDAVFADVDGDGAVDVISSCEGRTNCMFVHWAPQDPAAYLDEKAWRTAPIPLTKGTTRWMFALPLRAGREKKPLIAVSAKGKNALVGILRVPPDPRKLEEWKLRKLYDAGWIMSLVAADVDGDGDEDLVVSDRKGTKRGVLWLENPGGGGPWPEHRVGAGGKEVMFLDYTDLDGDGRADILAAVKPRAIHRFRSPADPGGAWPETVIPVDFPAGIGTAKAVRAGDIDGDGAKDIVFSCEHAVPPKRGVVWLTRGKPGPASRWTAGELAGPEGIKYDLLQLLDIDGDGDLDVLTCEERFGRGGLGVFWYENPFDRLSGSK